MSVNAAVNPDFASVAMRAEGPPFKETISANAIAETNRTPAIDSW